MEASAFEVSPIKLVLRYLKSESDQLGKALASCEEKAAYLHVQYVEQLNKAAAWRAAHSWVENQISLFERSMKELEQREKIPL